MADTKTDEKQALSDAEKAMAAMVGGDEAAGDDMDMAALMGGGEERLLDQEEIDSLLGFDDGKGNEATGVMALVNSAMVNYERLPMLDIVFDRLVRLMSTTLRNLTSDTVDVSLDQVSTVRFGDYMDSIPLPALISVFKAEEWDNSGLLVSDSAMIYSIVDVLLGGRKGTPAIRVEGRPYTTIEQKLVERMVQVTLNDLSSAFDPLSPVSFNLERMETNPRFATISQGGNACVLARLRVDMGDRGGRVEILIPYATLEPIRELLLQMFMGEKFGRDSIWENHLTEELYQTDVQLQAVLGELAVPLRDMLKWKEGTRLILNTYVDDEVELRCGHVPMFRGPMGQRLEKIAVKIDKYIQSDTRNED